VGQHAGMTQLLKISIKIISDKQVGQHPGIFKLLYKKCNLFFYKKRVGQHHRNAGSTCFGMVGQHAPESTARQKKG